MMTEHKPTCEKRPSMDISKMIRPLPETAILRLPDYYLWCGTMARHDDGKYYVLYSRWPKATGFFAWVTHSEVAVAVSDSPFGPFEPCGVALPERGNDFWDGHCTHNPTVKRFNGKYYLYYMGNRGNRQPVKGLNWDHRNNQRVGVAVADHPAGPWQRFDQPLVDTTPGFWDAVCCNNPSVTERPDGGYLMVYKAVGARDALPFGGPVVHVAALSESPTGPFVKQPNPVFYKEGERFAAEDPFIWMQDGHYWGVVKDNHGAFTGAGKTLLLFESSDGVAWQLSAEHPIVSKIEVVWEKRGHQALYSLERPQIWLKNGKPAVLLCAASDTTERTDTFNLQIPLCPPEEI